MVGSINSEFDMEYRLWSGAFTKHVFHEFISDLCRCYSRSKAIKIPNESVDLLYNWFENRNVLKIYVLVDGWICNFEIRKDSLVVGRAMIDYRFLREKAEWTCVNTFEPIKKDILSLQQLCRNVIVGRIKYKDIKQLPLPDSMINSFEFDKWEANFIRSTFRRQEKHPTKVPVCLARKRPKKRNRYYFRCKKNY